MNFDKEQWTIYFKFFDALRDTGATNMFGAGDYLKEAFPELSRSDTQLVLSWWMQTYSDAPAEARIATIHGATP